MNQTSSIIMIIKITSIQIISSMIFPATVPVVSAPINGSIPVPLPLIINPVIKHEEKKEDKKEDEKEEQNYSCNE